MAESLALTMESFSAVEPMRKNRFLVQFQTGGSGGLNEGGEGLSIACHSCTVPKLTITDKELHRFNDRVYVPGKGEFDSVEFEFYEYINMQTGSTGEGTKSAGDILWGWLNKVYNPATGVAGYKSGIKNNALIAQFDGAGNVVRTWNLYYAWPTTVEFDNLDSTSDDVQNVKVSLRYDWAALNETGITYTPTTTGTGGDET